MYKKIFSTILFLLFLLPFQTQVEASSVVVPQHNVDIIATKIDPRTEVLAKYLATFNSPLQYHAQDFIDAADAYDLDWKLVVSIAGVESTFGKRIPGGYNGWGWGVYGTQAIYFSSWRDGIFTVSKGLRENYVNKGYTEPYSMNRIYAASPTWGSKVTFFMNKLEQFAISYQADNIVVRPDESQIAAVSAQLVY